MTQTTPATTELPITALLPALCATLAKHNRLVLQAPPGAGKTTRVPLALLDEPWLGGRKIIVLEPRRLAARHAATRLAEQLGESPGAQVGYRMRQETQVGPQTRIEVVTEGILSRILQRDPMLEGVGLIIFDEFHERSLQADLGLALCLDSQQALRDDLRILVMSATLETDAVAALLDNAPVLTSQGRSFPVSIHHQPLAASFEQQWPAFCQECARTIAAICQRHSGDILVFLPGMGEIRRVQEHLNQQLSDLLAHHQLLLTPLHGQLSNAEQERALRPATHHGQPLQKIVLATSIAETSLTIAGVEVVVDCGLMRLPRFDPNSGLTRLVTQRVSQAAADQRAGRAGRLGPGSAYRLWPESVRLQATSEPEIRQADLAPLAMELAQWGVNDPAQLRWLDPPPPGPLAQARELLKLLGALDNNTAPTRHGEAMMRLGTHPRLAHMMLRGRELGLSELACTIAAVVEERDPWRDNRNSDLCSRVEQLLIPPRQPGGDRAALRRIRQQAQAWQQQLRQSRGDTANTRTTAPGDTPHSSDRIHAHTGTVLAFAYPDRIARRRDTAGTGTQLQRRYQLSNGRGAWLRADDGLGTPDYLVAAWLDGEREARIQLAAPIHREQLESHHQALIREVTQVGWDRQQQAVRAERQQRLGAWVLTTVPLSQISDEQVQTALLAGIREQGLDALPWDKASEHLRQRLSFLHQQDPERWSDVSNAALLATLETWLLPYLTGMSRLSHLRRLALTDILLSRLDWSARQQLDEWAPSHWTVPSGSRIRIDYSQQPPVLAVRLQELFGLTRTPTIAQGRVALVLHLLSPAQRLVQVTQDLAAFWHGSYHEVKRELKGRYPKHVWPDDPLTATPTARAKPRR